MEITEQKDLTTIVRDLWLDFFPNRDTPATEIKRTAANKDWIKESLLFYGWAPDKLGKLDINLSYIDGAAVLYCARMPCVLLSVQDLDTTPKLRFTYVDNRIQ